MDPGGIKSRFIFPHVGCDLGLRVDEVQDDVDVVGVREEMVPEQYCHRSDLRVGVMLLAVLVGVVAETEAHGDPDLRLGRAAVGNCCTLIVGDQA